jgi:hypothetical protein
MAFHAKLSPSAAHRWMNCAGSVALIGDESSTTNDAAMKGTAAHKIIELMITHDIHDARAYHGYTVLVHGPGEHETEVYEPDTVLDLNRPGWFLFICDEDMVNGVQCTIDEVDRIREEIGPHAEIYQERYLDGSWLDPRFGGTADISIIDPFEWGHLVDHKNGYILVEAKDNEQLGNYGVFMLHEHPDLEGVTVTISQPNAPHVLGPIRSESYTRDELKVFEIRMKEAAAAVDAPNAPLRAGDWCTFCPAKTRCAEFDAQALLEAQADFSEEPGDEPLPVPRDVEELSRKARWIPLLDGWARQIEGDIQMLLESGTEVPGWKLVRGKANRKWDVSYTDYSIAQAFEELGVPAEELWTKPELRSPAQIEKLGTGKAVRKAVKGKVSELAFKPEGRLTVAEDTDPREAVSAAEDAADEFAADSEDDFSV